MIPAGFRGSAVPRSATIYAEIAAMLGCEAAVVRAVVDVEAAGKGFLDDSRPKILFERHWFHRLTEGRYSRIAPEVSSPEAGGYDGGAAEYSRLHLALDLDRSAALRSTSWGLPQVMGFNSTIVGYRDVEAFVEAMCAGEDQQLWAFAGFVSSAGLSVALREKAWAQFARRYNGPAYSRNRYDVRLVAAYAKALAEARDPMAASVRGPIAEVQALLCLAGHRVVVDGWGGPKTEAAIRAFQASHGLQVDGIAGPKTLSALRLQTPVPPRRAA